MRGPLWNSTIKRYFAPPWKWWGTDGESEQAWWHVNWRPTEWRGPFISDYPMARQLASNRTATCSECRHTPTSSLSNCLAAATSANGLHWNNMKRFSLLKEREKTNCCVFGNLSLHRLSQFTSVEKKASRFVWDSFSQTFSTYSMQFCKMEYSILLVEPKGRVKDMLFFKPHLLVILAANSVRVRFTWGLGHYDSQVTILMTISLLLRVECFPGMYSCRRARCWSNCGGQQ